MHDVRLSGLRQWRGTVDELQLDKDVKPSCQSGGVLYIFKVGSS